VSSAVEGPKANGGLGFSHLEGQSEERMSNDESRMTKEKTPEPPPEASFDDRNFRRWRIRYSPLQFGR
jgi:hypothetical protein